MMAGESDGPDAVAARLEAALERIAAAAAHRVSAPASVGTQPPPSAAPNTAEIAARLDGLIERLRGALAVRAG